MVPTLSEVRFRPYQGGVTGEAIEMTDRDGDVVLATFEVTRDAKGKLNAAPVVVVPDLTKIAIDGAHHLFTAARLTDLIK
jgi:hypothetical protein